MAYHADCSSVRINSQVVVRHLNTAVGKGHGCAWPKLSGPCFMSVY